MSIQSIASSSAGTAATSIPPVDDSRQLSESRAIERQQAQRTELELRKQEAPSTFVNAQGQATGTQINVIA